MSLKVIILAAGQGSRMRSDLPKVLHYIGGKPLLEHSVLSANALNPAQILVIHGNGSGQVQAQCAHLPVTWVHQKEQLGTGHAVNQAMPYCDDNDQILILCGDVPLISPQTLTALINSAVGGLGVLTAQVEDPTGLGRILRDAKGQMLKIVEQRDASPTEQAIQEINSGILCGPASLFKRYLPVLSNDNAQSEYYLTDVVQSAVNEGLPVIGQLAARAEETFGINTKWQLAMTERLFQEKQAKALAESGVTVMDPARLDIRGSVAIEPGVSLDVNVVLEGRVSIGAGAKIGQNVLIKDSKIGENVEIRANCVIESATIEEGCVVGPFAHLRPETHLKSKAKVGNFVETKKTVLGEGAKANHLSYLGDAEVGEGVNIGAGTITCNYDGANKHKTTIEKGAFIGSNSALVAPVTIHENATVGAGSTITQNVEAETLVVARSKQRSISSWKRPKKESVD